MKFFNHQQGLSLVELMVGLALGLMVAGAAMEIFISNDSLYKVNDGLARLQENGRYASYILSRDVRMAGYMGCSNLTNITVNVVVKNPSANLLTDAENSVTGSYGSGGSWSPALPSGLTSANVKANTDVVTVRSAYDLEDVVSSDMSQPTSAIQVTGRSNIQQNQDVLLTDCETADLFSVSNVSSAHSIAHGVGNNENTTSSLSKAYTSGAFVGVFESHSYYIGDSGRTNAAGNTIYSLFRMNLDGSKDELVEGVEEMKIWYGVDTTDDDNPDSFQTAATVETGDNWINVKSVKIALLLNTVEAVNPKVQSYTFNGAAVTPTDRLLRRQWNLFITLRNRSP